MTKQEFKNLTGEDPEDVLGGDWENEIDEGEMFKSSNKKIKKLTDKIK